MENHFWSAFLRVFLFIMVLFTSQAAIAQPAVDSITCLPNSVLRKAARANEELKIARMEIQQYKINTDTLMRWVALKDSIINKAARMEENRADAILNLNTQISAYAYKAMVDSTRIGYLEVSVKKHKRNSWIAGGAGLVVVLLAVFR